MTNCDAFSKKCEARSAKNGILKVPRGTSLFLRGGIFYFIIELPRVDGKRRYKRLSLKTDNYYVAREQIKELKKMFEPNYYIDELERLLNKLIIVGDNRFDGNLHTIHPFKTPKLSKKNHLKFIGCADKRLNGCWHCHLLLESRDGITPDDIMDAMYKTWGKQSLTPIQLHIEPILKSMEDIQNVLAYTASHIKVVKKTHFDTTRFIMSGDLLEKRN